MKGVKGGLLCFSGKMVDKIGNGRKIKAKVKRKREKVKKEEFLPRRKRV